jgi:hypothetical protein
MNLEQWGLFGIFLAGAIPWMEAIAVVPSGIALGINPVATVVAAVIGNSITIVMFAYAGASIRSRISDRRLAKGKSSESPRFEKAVKAFDRYGIYGMAALGPLIIGTQFAAAASVAAGVKPLRVSILVVSSMVLWSIAIAIVMVAFDINFEVL